MSFTLAIERRGGKGAEESVERRFERPHVTIGRGAASDVVLNDPQRLISSRHAEIRQKDGSWVLLDVGSTNGTVLNDRRLDPNREYPLNDGDRICVGSFVLVFRPAKRSAAATEVERAVASSPTPIVAGPDTYDDAERLLYLLRRAYADAECSNEGTGTNRLEVLVRQNIARLDRLTAQALVVSVRDRLASGTPVAKDQQPARSRAPASQEISRVSASTHEDSAVAYLDVVGKFCGELDQPLSKSELDRAIRRVTQILDIVFAGIADAVRGRRKFQKEFEVEATQILSWKPNPIKQAENAEEIGAMLLNPGGKGLTEEQAEDSLKEVFQDLTLHQLGLLAGFRECVRGLLKELDPEVIGNPAKGGSAGKGLGLLGGGNVRAEAAAWRKYIEKHRQLTEEEVKVFERILAPQFAKGYLSVYKTRRRR